MKSTGNYMTELSFLIDLLLNGRLQPKTKELVKNRIQEVESRMVDGTVNPKQLIQGYKRVQESLLPPVEVIATTPEAAQALKDRQSLIQSAINQKHVEVPTGGGTRGPRKF
jgi:hypothetical protein